MHRIKSLLTSRAESFRTGELHNLAENLITPTAVYVDETLVPVLNSHHNALILWGYREKLLTLGYKKTEFDILELEESSSDTYDLKTKVNWRHLNGQGKQIASLMVIHYWKEVGSELREDTAEIITAESDLITDFLDEAKGVANRKRG